MIPKIVFLVLATLNGAWMVFDGAHVLFKGKYIGPPEPGPWSKIVAKVGLDPFSLGPLFIVLGLIWIVAAISILQGSSWGWLLALSISFATLWYISIGTVFSLLSIAVLIFYKANLGYA